MSKKPEPGLIGGAGPLPIIPIIAFACGLVFGASIVAFPV